MIFHLEHVVECPVSTLYTCAENDWNCPYIMVLFDKRIYSFPMLSFISYWISYFFLFQLFSSHFSGFTLNLQIKPQYCMYNIWRSRLTLGNLCDMCFFLEFSKTYPNAYVSNNSKCTPMYTKECNKDKHEKWVISQDKNKENKNR